MRLALDAIAALFVLAATMAGVMLAFAVLALTFVTLVTWELPGFLDGY